MRTPAIRGVALSASNQSNVRVERRNGWGCAGGQGSAGARAISHFVSIPIDRRSNYLSRQQPQSRRDRIASPHWGGVVPPRVPATIALEQFRLPSDLLPNDLTGEPANVANLAHSEPGVALRLCGI